jgi:hypothetical protein
MITGFMIRFIIVLYLKSNFKGRVKLNFIIVLIGDDDYLTYTSFQTGGLINNRYANQDAQGRDKKTS